mmetsp:Transcript_3848/g.10674  ORF Transcript_3848/g.10674 Transcript_3848/m.10674 type:complete len:319 (+) Transcript_3848:1181-2137(+)
MALELAHLQELRGGDQNHRCRKKFRILLSFNDTADLRGTLLVTKPSLRLDDQHQGDSKKGHSDNEANARDDGDKDRGEQDLVDGGVHVASRNSGHQAPPIFERRHSKRVRIERGYVDQKGLIFSRFKEVLGLWADRSVLGFDCHHGLIGPTARFELIQKMWLTTHRGDVRLGHTSHSTVHSVQGTETIRGHLFAVMHDHIEQVVHFPPKSKCETCSANGIMMIVVNGHRASKEVAQANSLQVLLHVPRKIVERRQILVIPQRFHDVVAREDVHVILQDVSNFVHLYIELIEGAGHTTGIVQVLTFDMMHCLSGVETLF